MNFVPNVELTRTHGLGNPNGNYIEWLGPLIWPPPLFGFCVLCERFLVMALWLFGPAAHI